MTLPILRSPHETLTHTNPRYQIPILDPHGGNPLPPFPTTLIIPPDEFHG